MPMYINFFLALLASLSTYFSSAKISYFLWFLTFLAIIANFLHHTTSSLNLSY